MDLWMIQDSHFDHILPGFARMALKLSGHECSDDSNRPRMFPCDFGSFKKYYCSKMMNLWMIQDSHLDHILPGFDRMAL